jgi:hypothetical protein
MSNPGFRVTLFRLRRDGKTPGGPSLINRNHRPQEDSLVICPIAVLIGISLIIAPIMTDREMALALGNYINELLAKIAAMEAVLAERRVTDPQGRIQWRDDVSRVLLDPASRRLSDAQSRVLLQTVGDETQASALIRALCRNYFQA